MSDAASPASAAGPQTPEVVDSSYYADGLRWEEEIYRRQARSRALAWTLAFVSTGTTIACLGILWALVPLKTFEPYVVLVDKTTGYTEVARALAPGGRVTQDEAVTTANVVRFVRARETFDPRGVKENYDLAQLLADEAAARDLADLYAPTNPRNPAKVLGPNASVAVTVKSVTFPNTRTALVRFQSDERSVNATMTRHWVGIVRFRYANAPLRNDWRFDNPLGFQVIEYRRDQETVTPVEGGPAVRS